MPSTPPGMTGVLETVLYVTDLDRADAFYGGVLGLRRLDGEPGRSLFYRAGGSVFLLFNAAATRVGGRLPAHGADGAGHTCFEVPPESYEAWKRHLAHRGIRVTREVRWDRGRSFYFEDPDGNVLEIANGDFWPR